jgi:hypothetical protein
VLSDLISVMNQVRPDAIFVTHPRDVHPDHFATYMFVRYALATAAARGAAWAQTARAYGYLVHWPRYPGPASLTTGRALLPPPGLSRDTTQWLRFPLTRDQRRLKLRQVRAYRSQKPSFDRLLLAFVRENEAFDLLPPQETAPGSRVHWLIPGPRRRGLNGAKVSDVDLTVRENLSVRASLILASRKMPQNGYVCLDLRTWDDAGTPVITATYLRSGNRKSAIRLGRGTQASAIRLGPGTRAKTAPVLVHNASPTQMDILGLKLPSESLARQALFVSCWGSVRDRIISPGVSTLLTFGAPRSD